MYCHMQIHMLKCMPSNTYSYIKITSSVHANYCLCWCMYVFIHLCLVEHEMYASVHFHIYNTCMLFLDYINRFLQVSLMRYPL